MKNRIIIFTILAFLWVGASADDQLVQKTLGSGNGGSVQATLVGDQYELAPIPANNYRFLQWLDGTTDSLRYVSVSSLKHYGEDGIVDYKAVFTYSPIVETNRAQITVTVPTPNVESYHISLDVCDVNTFICWSDNKSVLERDYTEADGNLRPCFRPIESEPTGDADVGHIELTDADCGYQLTAVPEKGYAFAGWLDDPTAPATRTVSLLAATYEAEFSEVLNVTIHNNGLPDFPEGALSNVTLQRPLSADSYNTICLPFDMALSEFGVACEAYALTGSSMDNGMLVVSFNTPVETLEAGKPYLIKPASATSSNIVLASPKRLSNTTTNASSDYVDFMAALNPTELSNDGNTLFLGANDLLYRPATTDNMPGLRGYFTTHDLVVNVPMRLAINERQIATSIDKVPNAQAITKFIRNNQMVIRVRDIEYNAQGAIIH